MNAPFHPALGEARFGLSATPIPNAPRIPRWHTKDHAVTETPMVLVVDDEPAIVEMMADLLRDEGYRVCTAGSGTEALTVLRGGLRPSLIILDLRMSDLNGWDFRRLQLADPNLATIPVVICTGATERPLEHVITTAAGVLRKPLSADMLLSTAARIVSGN